MITAEELRKMKTTQYGEDSVDLALAMNLVMVDIVYKAKDGMDYHRIEGEEHYDRETPESCYVLDYLEDLGYYVDTDAMFDIDGEVQYSTIISW